MKTKDKTNNENYNKAKIENGTFNQNYLATVGLDNITKDETIDGKNIRIKIWDTAGQERYKALTKGFFNNAEGIMIVFDVTNSETYDNLKNWIQSIQNFMGNKMEEIPIIIIGNKIDCEEREVKTEDAESFCKGQNYPYFETSAKTGENIDKTIRFLVKKIIDGNTDSNQNEGSGNNNIRISKEELKKKEGGCSC